VVTFRPAQPMRIGLPMRAPTIDGYRSLAPHRHTSRRAAQYCRSRSRVECSLSGSWSAVRVSVPAMHLTILSVRELCTSRVGGMLSPIGGVGCTSQPMLLRFNWEFNYDWTRCWHSRH
jgi:hypothetical protein